MKKEVGICFEFCRQIGFRGGNWGGGGKIQSEGGNSPLRDVTPKRRGESTHSIGKSPGWAEEGW